MTATRADELFPTACSIAAEKGFVSVGILKAELQCGAKPASEIIARMRAEGLIGEPTGNKPAPWLGGGATGVVTVETAGLTYDSRWNVGASLADLVAGHELTPPMNIRAPDDRLRIDAIAATMRARIGEGDAPLIEPLIVAERRGEGPPGLYAVVDGGFRFAALRQLVTEGLFPPDAFVEVRVVPADRALEISTLVAETHTPAHPVDLYNALALIAGDGDDQPARIERLARQRGMPNREVKKLVALGRLAPGVRQAWRADEIDEEAAKAFADGAPDAQEEALARLRKSGGAHKYAIREALNVGHVLITPTEEVLCGPAYRAAGGRVKESLFEEERWALDGRLWREKESEAVRALHAEVTAKGWGEVFVVGYSSEPWNAPTHYGLPRWSPDGPIDRIPDIEWGEKYWEAAKALPPEERAALRIETRVGLADDAGKPKAVLLVDRVVIPDSRDIEDPVDDEDEDLTDDEFDEGDARGSPMPAPPPGLDYGGLSNKAKSAMGVFTTRVVARVIAGDPDVALIALVAALTSRTGGAYRFDRVDQAPIVVFDRGARMVAEEHATQRGGAYADELARADAMMQEAELYEDFAASAIGGRLAALVAGMLDLTTETLWPQRTEAEQKRVSPVASLALVEWLASRPDTRRDMADAVASTLKGPAGETLVADMTKADLALVLHDAGLADEEQRLKKLGRDDMAAALLARLRERAETPETAWMPGHLRVEAGR